ncbi:MAG: hypothetical protein KR126chlam2_00491 [Chlamydiae bacterium]|nr:hypothetical protein [Chlamydiota bacterium]
MTRKKKKKRAVTLIEIMIVIMLISLIGGALAFNMRGSMDQGRAFKSEQNIARVRDILLMADADGNLSTEEVVEKWQFFVGKSPLVDASKVIVDGWNQPLNVVKNDDDDIVVTSDRLSRYRTDHAIK